MKNQIPMRASPRPIMNVAMLTPAVPPADIPDECEASNDVAAAVAAEADVVDNVEFNLGLELMLVVAALELDSVMGTKADDVVGRNVLVEVVTNGVVAGNIVEEEVWGAPEVVAGI
jgi:hypothetical protein